MDNIVEWELTLQCNYNCKYCNSLDSSIMPVVEEQQLFEFIKKVSTNYPKTEIFLFGGEPFLHPKINFIINTFLALKHPFVVQTNFSSFSVKKIQKITKPFPINISIHPDECKISDVLNNLKKIKADGKISIKNIDVICICKL